MDEGTDEGTSEIFGRENGDRGTACQAQCEKSLLHKNLLFDSSSQDDILLSHHSPESCNILLRSDNGVNPQ